MNSEATTPETLAALGTLLDSDQDLDDAQLALLRADQLETATDATRVHALLLLMHSSQRQPRLPAAIAELLVEDVAVRELGQRVAARMRYRRAAHVIRRWRLFAAAAVILLSMGAVWYTRTPASTPAPLDSETQIAEAISSRPWSCAGATIPADVLRTVSLPAVISGGAGVIKLRLNDGSQLRLAPHGELQSPKHTNNNWRLTVGHLEAEIVPQKPGTTFTCETADGIVRVIGTKLSVATDAQGTTVEVSKGRVQVITPDRQTFLNAGESVLLGPRPARVPLAAGTGFDLPWLGYCTPMPVFNDRLLQARGWTKGETNSPAAITARGWPSTPLPREGASCSFLTDIGGMYRGGTWTLTWAGQGEVELKAWNKPLEELSRDAQRLSVHVTPTDGMLLTVRSSSPTDPVRDIRFIPDEQPDGAGLTPEFVADWSGMAWVRGGAWLPIPQGQTSLHWSQRVQPGDGPGHDAGRRSLSHESFATVVQKLGAPAWWVVPVHASDDYVENLAQLAARTVVGNHVTIVSYSNADLVDNDDERIWLHDAGLAIGHQPTVAAARYAAERSLDIFTIWKAVFAHNHLPLACVIPGGDLTWMREICTWRRCGVHADAISIPDQLLIDCNPLANDTEDSAFARLKADTVFALARNKKFRPRLQAALGEQAPPPIWLDYGVGPRSGYPPSAIASAAIRRWYADDAIQKAVTERTSSATRDPVMLTGWDDRLHHRIVMGAMPANGVSHRVDLPWLGPPTAP